MRVSTVIFAALIALTLPAYADAPLPDTHAAPAPGLSGEGPPGCGWRATVTDMHPGDNKTVDLVLLQKISTCMYNPGPCGAKGNPFSVAVKKDDIHGYQAGQIIKVWVTGTTVSFDRAECGRNPG